jgi:XTP/dITP diphosphohydrolase
MIGRRRPRERNEVNTTNGVTTGPQTTKPRAISPLVIGTRNSKKLEEMRKILGAHVPELRDLSSYPDAPSVEEDGSTFEENAAKKARELARALNCWVLGEDSGLVVPALKGRPGVYSARYAGKHGDDEANNQKLLAESAPLPRDRRDAYYVCSLALADASGTIQATMEGRCGGVITERYRGTNGFGYDPIFEIVEYHHTFGELSPRVKQAISHRARACERLLQVLASLLRRNA